MHVAIPDLLLPSCRTATPASEAGIRCSRVGGTVSTVQDRILAGLIERSHGREAIAAYLGVTGHALMRRVVDLGLPTPHDHPPRQGKGPRSWTLADIRRLIEFWTRNLVGAAIGGALNRSAGGVYRKARWLGLPRRDRAGLTRELPSQLQPLAEPQEPQEPQQPGNARPARQEIRWTQALEDELAERWFALQHHRAIARDMGLSPTTIASKAHRLELPRRDPGLLLQFYDPANKAGAAHLFRGLIKRRCRHSGRWFWAQRNGSHTSREATKSAGYRDLIGGFSEASVASCQAY